MKRIELIIVFLFFSLSFTITSCDDEYVDGQKQGTLRVKNTTFHSPSETANLHVNAQLIEDRLFVDVKGYGVAGGTYALSVKCKAVNDTLYFTTTEHGGNSRCNCIDMCDWSCEVTPVTKKSFVIALYNSYPKVFIPVSFDNLEQTFIYDRNDNI